MFEKKEERSYLRRCEACGQFMNWRVFNDGSAMCLNCGRTHAPIPKPTQEQWEEWEKVTGKKK